MREMTNPFGKLPEGISSYAAMKYGLHEGNVDEVRKLAAEDRAREAHRSALDAALAAHKPARSRAGKRKAMLEAIAAYIGSLTDRGYSVIAKDEAES